jgi:hypothetical protein
MNSRSEDDEKTRRQAESGDSEGHPHVQAAADLSDRAAESVSRRYDGTKEAYHETGQEEDDETDHTG